MATEIWNQSGRRVWGADRDDDGHHDYELITQVRADTPNDGPATVMNTSGLPAVGSYWLFGTDIDVWAFCWPTMSVRPFKDDEPNVFWNVKQKFSTRSRWRCQDATVENPLLEPPRIGGSFVKFSRETRFDRFGEAILTSAGEPIRGPQVEFDEMYPTVWVEYNDVSAYLPLLSSASRKPVNDAPMWGVGPRCVKLDQITWELKVFGRCGFYYTKRFELSVSFDTFDRDVPDAGSRFKDGAWWPPGAPGAVWNPVAGSDATVAATDYRGNIIEYHLLDGNGGPLPPGDPPVKKHVEKYEETNLFLLGLPAVL